MWVWVNSGSWWWTGRPGTLQFMGSQIVRHDWATELNNDAVIVLYFTLLNERVCVSTVINAVKLTVIVVICFSVAKLCLTLCNPTDSSIPGFPVLHYLLKFARTPVHWVKDAIQPAHPLSPPSSPFSLPQHQGFFFQWVSSSHQVPKYWNFSLSISPSNEYSVLISFRIDWFDLFTVQGTLRVFSSTTV